MTASINNLVVLSALVVEPRVGAWTAVVDADSEQPLTGKVTLTIEGVSWVGTVVRSNAANGRLHLQIVGGGAGLGKVLDAKFYEGTTLGTVLGDILSECGETLADSTPSQVTAAQAGRWMRSFAGAGQALRQVADELGVVWRVQRDGSVWLGSEGWPAAELGEHTEITRASDRGLALVAPKVPTLRPGSVYTGQHVSMVTTTLNTEDGLRQELLFEDDADSGYGREVGDFVASVEAVVGNRIDYSRMYPARVVAQDGDTLELIADDVKVRGTGLKSVPIRHGLPGVKVTVNPNAKVLLFFEDGEPSQPAAALWPTGASVKRIEITTGDELAITAPTVRVFGDLVVSGEVTALGGTMVAGVPLFRHTGHIPQGTLSIPQPVPPRVDLDLEPDPAFPDPDHPDPTNPNTPVVGGPGTAPAPVSEPATEEPGPEPDPDETADPTPPESADEASAQYAFTAPFEGIVNHMYLDTRGYVTAGVGFMFPNAAAAQKLPFQTADGPASADQIADDFARVKASEPAHVARYYTRLCTVTLTTEAMNARFEEICASIRKQLQGPIPTIMTMPTPARIALVDMAYNMGVYGLTKRWPNLMAAVNAGDWLQCAERCQRKGVQQVRNDKTKQLFEQAAQAVV